MYSLTRSSLTARRVIADPARFATLFASLRIPTSTWRNWDLLGPLLTQHYDHDALALFALGDVVIQSAVHDAVQEYCMRHRCVASPNLVRCCGAAFYHPYALRLAADDIGLLDLANGTSAADAEAPEASLMSLLEEPVREPSSRDVKGTAFEHHLHDFAQTPLGIKISHLIAAIHIDQGPAMAATIARRLLRMEHSVDVPGAAMDSLRETVRRYYSGPVALSLLSAMGIAVTWGVAIRPGTVTDTAAAKTSAPPMSNVMTTAAPEGMTLLQRMRSYEPSQVAEHSDLMPIPGVPSGWLPVAAAASPSPPPSYCDSIGFALPTGGFFSSSRRKFARSNEVDEYYGHDKDKGRGMALETHGLSVPEHIQSFRCRTPRVFTVTATAQNTKGVIAVAEADSFTGARIAALEKVLVGVAQDLHGLGNGRYSFNVGQ